MTALTLTLNLGSAIVTQKGREAAFSCLYISQVTHHRRNDKERSYRMSKQLASILLVLLLCIFGQSGCPVAPRYLSQVNFGITSHIIIRVWGASVISKYQICIEIFPRHMCDRSHFKSQFRWGFFNRYFYACVSQPLPSAVSVKYEL